MRYLFLALCLAACQAGTPADRLSAAPPDTVALSPTPHAATGPTVAFGGRTITVEVADTPEARRQGLSGRASLAPDTGLVLAWPYPTQVGIWMPDMRFAIDVIFVRDNKVVAIYADAQPCPPSGYCPTFGPDTEVNYVLEVPAGSAARWGLKAGDAITLNSTRTAQADEPEFL